MLPLRLLALLIGLALALPATAGAHGGDESSLARLSRQPARVLAQQAHALLHIRHDRAQAAVRLDAAVASKDNADVDVPSLGLAMQTLDRGGSDQRVMDLIDQALSRPFGAERGKVFHGAGRELSGVQDGQETVGLILGLVILAGAFVGLRRRTEEATDGSHAGRA